MMRTRSSSLQTLHTVVSISLTSRSVQQTALSTKHSRVLTLKPCARCYNSDMIFKPLHWLALSAALVAATALTPSSAKNAYRLQAIQQYSVTSMGCIYCHTSPSGGSNWNAFGTSLKTIYLGTAKSNISEALYLVLKANKDSDADGYTDTLEIVAKTLPGDKASKPTKTVKALEAQLKALGCVEKFKAKK